jgi:SulP family sulfate permease
VTTHRTAQHVLGLEETRSRGSAAAKTLEIVTGGSAVAVIGLSLTLAAGALSLTPLGPEALASGVVASFIAATLGGLCVSLISRAPGEVSGPLSSIVVVYAALCADLIVRGGPNLHAGDVFAALSLAVVMMGVLQMLAGLLRIGDAIKFLPHPVSAGFVSGIGLLIVWSQVGPLLGLEGRLASYHWADLVEHFKPLALLIGILTAATVWLIPIFTKRAQPLLAALVIGTLIYHLAAPLTGQDALGPTLGTIEPFAAAQANFSAVWKPVTPAWLLATGIHVFPYALFLALQAVVNAALTCVAVADITGKRARVNRTLIAQGIGNVVSGGIGGLPIGSSPSQSMVAATMPNVNHIVPGASAIILLVVIAAFGRFLNHIPLVVLAGILVTAGIGLIDRWARTLVKRTLRGDARGDIKWNLCIVAAVAGTFFFGSVPLALLVGTVLAMILLTISLSSATIFAAQDGSNFSSTRVWPPAQTQSLATARSTVRVLRPRGGLFFATADQLAETLARLDHSVRFCVIDFSLLTTLDATGCQIVAASAKRLAARRVTTLLAGLDPADPRDSGLVHLGLTTPAQSSWYANLDHALEAIETELLRDHCGYSCTDAPVSLSDTAFGKGLSESELQTLQAEIRCTDNEAGATLFKAGDPGSSLYIIGSGEVEIRTGNEIMGGVRRLAVFGPGCMFGEVALVTGGLRTADALCTKPTRLYEVTSDSLSTVVRRSPVIYGKIMANLNEHLATRLVIATEIVRGQR